jgi:acetyl-CoA acetyltransferase
MRRLDLVAGHLVETSSVDAAGACTRSDCVIVAGKRSAFGKAGKGAFANTRVEDLVSPVFRALLEKPVHVDDVLMGKVRLLFFFFFFFGLFSAKRRKVAGDSGVGHQSVRRAMFIAGLDETTSCSMMNRACASGLETIATMHAKIVTNQVNVGIAGGVESMSLDRLQSVGKAAEPPKRHPA